jgi:formate-dependent nitrite reductase membrane component NrfD
MEGFDFSKLITDGSVAAKILGILVAIQFMLFGIATGLTKIAIYTENKWDNKAAAILSQIAWFLGVFIGKFGYSVPKAVLEEKALQLAEKELSSVVSLSATEKTES